MSTLLPRSCFLMSSCNKRNQPLGEMATSRTGTGNIQEEPEALCSTRKWGGAPEKPWGWRNSEGHCSQLRPFSVPEPERSEQNQQESITSSPNVEVSESTLTWLLNFKGGENRQFCREFQTGYVAAWPARWSVLCAPPWPPPELSMRGGKKVTPCDLTVSEPVAEGPLERVKVLRESPYTTCGKALPSSLPKTQNPSHHSNNLRQVKLRGILQNN